MKEGETVVSGKLFSKETLDKIVLGDDGKLYWTGEPRENIPTVEEFVQWLMEKEGVEL